MIIHFSPVSMYAHYSLEVAGNSIIISGVQYDLADLAALGEGDPRSPFVVSATADSVTLLLPYWGEPSAAVAFPQSLVDPADGFVELPQ